MTKTVIGSSRKGKDVTCEAILDAAEDLLARYGYKRMTMDDLAHAVGLSKGALYLRFKSKEDVALSMIDRINTRVQRQLEQLLEQPNEPKDRIVQLLVQRVMSKYDSVRKYYAAFDEVYAALRPEIVKRRERYLNEESKLIAVALDMGVTEESFFCDDSDKTASMLVLATNALLPYRLNPDEMAKRKELHERALELASFLVKALTPVRDRQSQLYGVKN